MDISLPTPLLGGMSPQDFMQRHWQKKPLLIRGAIPGIAPPLTRSALFSLAASEGVESRLVERRKGTWNLRNGPFARRALPPLTQPEWTLLVQGVDLHADAARRLLQRFRFVPDARLDDLMISYATDGGGVGPHYDSYDVFLLQVQGTRRWRIAKLVDSTLKPDVPLKILDRFEAEEEWLLEPGDMLYLPPSWAHDGTAVGACMTCSIGFRAPSRAEAARETLARVIDNDDLEDRHGAAKLYRDASQAATDRPAEIPTALHEHARDAIARMLNDGPAVQRAVGEWLSEPKPQVWFGDGEPLVGGAALELDRRSRMLYDDQHVFINGESYRAAGRDAKLMRRLADQRTLAAVDIQRAGVAAATLLEEWAQAGWLHSIKEDA